MTRSELLSLYWKILRTPTRKLLITISARLSERLSGKLLPLKMLFAPSPVFRAFFRPRKKRPARSGTTTAKPITEVHIDPLVFGWRDLYVFARPGEFGGRKDLAVPEWSSIERVMQAMADEVLGEMKVRGEVYDRVRVRSSYPVAGRIVRLEAFYAVGTRGGELVVTLERAEETEYAARHLTAVLN